MMMMTSNVPRPMYMPAPRSTGGRDGRAFDLSLPSDAPAQPVGRGKGTCLVRQNGWPAGSSSTLRRSGAGWSGTG
jgi:hypothetical protein